MDDVVEVYHEGFAKSIQNYSRILQLFQETKQQVAAGRDQGNSTMLPARQTTTSNLRPHLSRPG